MSDPIPTLIYQDIKRLLQEGFSGSIVLHVRTGKVMGATGEYKVVLGLRPGTCNSGEDVVE